MIIRRITGKISEIFRSYGKRAKEARTLYKRSGGVLLVFIALFSLLRGLILKPAGRAVWNAVMQTVPGGYITDGTASSLLRCPQVVVAGLVFCALQCIIIVWQISGILLCLEYHEEGKAVRLFRLFPNALLNMRHLLHPRNWLFFLYIAVLLPLVSLYDASGFQAQFEIPEYISDFIFHKIFLTLLLLAVYAVTAYLVMRWFFVLQGCLLKRQSFAEAARESARLTKGKKLYHLFITLIFQAFQLIRTVLLPAVAAVAVFAGTMYLRSGYPGMFACARVFYMEDASKQISSLASMFLQMASMCFLLSCYRAVLREDGQETSFPLPESGEKSRGRIWKFRGLRPVCFAAVILGFSFLFLVFTEILRISPEAISDLSSETKIAAHKGYSSIAPENTLTAFQKAVDCGCADMIELDIRETKDGIPVVIHNASLQSAIGVNKTVYELTYDEIRQYTASYDYTPEEFPDAYIPTLEETLQKFADKIPLIIEIKADKSTPDLPAKIVALMQKYNCTDTCVIHSGSYASLEAVKAIDPSISCGYIIALSAGNYYNLPCADFFSVEHNFVDSDMISDIHRLDKEVYVWTVNEEHSIEKMGFIGADVIITDVPETVHESIREDEDDIVEFWQEVLQNDDEKPETSSDYEAGNY